jgi:hypothetical protein
LGSPQLQLFKVAPIRVDTGSKSNPPLLYCPTNDALIEAMPLLDQVVDVTNPAAVDAFLQHAPDLVGCPADSPNVGSPNVGSPNVGSPKISSHPMLHRDRCHSFIKIILTLTSALLRKENGKCIILKILG